MNWETLHTEMLHLANTENLPAVAQTHRDNQASAAIICCTISRFAAMTFESCKTSWRNSACLLWDVPKRTR